jgi:hypothetical protein
MIRNHKRKVGHATTVTLSASITTIIVWLLQSAGIDVPPAVSAALATVIGYLARCLELFFFPNTPETS